MSGETAGKEIAAIQRIIRQSGGWRAIMTPPKPGIAPHPYEPGGRLCKVCGGGLLHEIHWIESQGKPLAD